MLSPEIIYEDENFLAVNKPVGVLIHKVKSSKFKDSEETLVDWLLKNYPEVKSVGDLPACLPVGMACLPVGMAGGQATENIRPGIVHRLDKDTSGVVLIAKNQKYFDYLKSLFEKNEIKKTYLALVWGKVEPRSGIIDKPIGITKTVKRTIGKGKMLKEAITEYKVIKFFPFFSLVKVFPKTGRTHQIRVHLSSIGHPIVGDLLYSRKQNPFGLKRQFLHAESLEFNLMEGGHIKIEAELPEELNKLILRLTDESIDSSI